MIILFALVITTGNYFKSALKETSKSICDDGVCLERKIESLCV